MSLQVWLPLTEDLHNQGLSNLIFNTLSSNTILDNNGKIGKCYYNNSPSSGGLISNTTIDLGQEQSMFCWFKFTSLTSSSSLGGGLVSQHRYPSNNGMGITIKYVSSTTGYLSVNTGNGSSRTYNTYCGTTLLQANTWYHGGYTYDGSTLKIYVNGICEKTQSISGMSVPADYLTVFCWSMSSSSGTGVYGGYKLNGYLNDVRIYDHCLSPKEVEEIAKGLVLHYLLNDRFCEATTNLITGLTAGGQTTVSNNIITTSGSNADTYFTLNLSENITNGTQYTIQCYAEMPIGTTWTFPIGAQSNSSLSWTLKPGYNEYTFTANDISWGTKRIFLDDLSGTARSSGVQCKFYNFQLEKKNHATGFSGYGITRTPTTIYDCSGYSNNGTISGALTVAAPSPRYDVATAFNGSSYIDSSMEINTIDSTIAIWMYMTNMTNKHILDMRNSSGNGKQPIYCYSDGHIQSGGSSAYITSNAGLIEVNKWIHIVLVQNGNNLLVYKNGELFQPAISCTNSSIIKPTIFARYTHANIPTGQLTDFRIYTTALTAAQVKELYNTSMSIDASGNVYARQLVS